MELTNKDPVKLEAERRETRGRRRSRRTQEIHGAGKGQENFFIWGGIVNFWGTRPDCRAVHEGFSSCSASNLLLLCHLWWEKRATTQTSLDHFPKRVDTVEPSKEPGPVPSTSVWMKLQLTLRLLLLMTLQLHHLPPPLPPPVSNCSCLFTRCQPLYASCCPILLYFLSLYYKI